MIDGPIGLLGLGAYVPDRVMTNDDWAEYVDTSDEWITTRTGIKTRRVAADDETTVDLAVAAAERALEDAAMAVTEIDEIIVATDTPEVYIPDTAPFLQQRLGAREVPSFDLAGSGCAGFVLGLDVARSRALSGGKKVLVVGVELLTRLMDWSDRATCVLFGDAAGAAVVGPTGKGGGEFLSFTAGTDGAQAEILGLEAGGTRRPFTFEGAERGEHKDIVMKGREVFKEAVTRMAAASTRSSRRPASVWKILRWWCHTRPTCGSSSPSRSSSAFPTTSLPSTSRTTATQARPRYRSPSGKLAKRAKSPGATWSF